jgi:hypothetical protein
MTSMNVDHILSAFNEAKVDYILIGGMNFLLRHSPILTFDVDIWIDDSPDNRTRCEDALARLNAEWGETTTDWKRTSKFAPGWLDRQNVFCLNSPHGAIDIFRSVTGLADWRSSAARAAKETTLRGTSYRGLSDADMLACQLALEPGQRKMERVKFLSQQGTSSS